MRVPFILLIRRKLMSCYSDNINSISVGTLVSWADVLILINTQQHVLTLRTDNNKVWNRRKFTSHRSVRKAKLRTCRHSLISAYHVRLRSYWLSDQSRLMTSISTLCNWIVLNMTSSRLGYIEREYTKIFRYPDSKYSGNHRAQHITYIPAELIEAERRIYTSMTKVIIDSDTGLSPVRRQTIIWTNTGILLIEPWDNIQWNLYQYAITFILSQPQCVNKNGFLVLLSFGRVGFYSLRLRYKKIALEA